MLLSRPKSRLARCAVFGDSRPYLTAVLVPSSSAEAWFESATHDEIARLIAESCASTPRYAVPRAYLIMRGEELERLGLITSNGRIRRGALLETIAPQLDDIYKSKPRPLPESTPSHELL